MIQKYRNYLSAVLRLADSTVDVYINNINRFTLYVARNSIEIHAVQRKDILRFMAERDGQQELSASTHIQMLAAITHLYNYLLTASVVEYSPTEFIKRPKSIPKIHRCWSEKSIQQIIESPSLNKNIGIRDRCFFELFYATGIRRQELVSLRVFDVDLTEKVVFIRGKGNRERMLPITLNALYWLEKYAKVRMELCRARL